MVKFSVYLNRRFRKTQVSNSARHAKTRLLLYAHSEGPDQLAHPHSLIRAFAVCKQNHWTLQNVSIESKGTNDILRMRGMNLCILRMLEDTFSPSAAQIIHSVTC